MAIAHESLNRSPRKNWVERAGQLPAAIQHMAKDIHEERGLPLDQAIPMAISQAKKLAAKGNAKYVTAVAEWEALKAKNKIKEAPVGALGMWLDEDDIGDLSLLEAGVTVNGSVMGAKMTAGQQLAARAKKPAAAKTRSGGSAAYTEAKHPRGRGGKWTIGHGASGADVSAIQSRVGGTKVDGQFGAKTKAAVMRFQRAHGLTVDGVVGHQTSVALAGHFKAARTAKVGGLKESDHAKLKALRAKK